MKNSEQVTPPVTSGATGATGAKELRAMAEAYLGKDFKEAFGNPAWLIGLDAYEKGYIDCRNRNAAIIDEYDKYIDYCFAARISSRDEIYAKEALLEEAKQKLALAERAAQDRAFTAVLDAAEKIYQEDMESDPSDYFFTKQAVAEALKAIRGEGSSGNSV